jgi:uncharacterized ferritin-like protein (DUF455 family)
VHVSDYALSIVDGPGLAAKLCPPSEALAYDAPSEGPRAPLVRTAPARDPAIALAARGTRLPSLGALADARTGPNARAACLSRFAHHELCAVELFAWALLAFPDLPVALQRGFVQTLAEEQEHCRLYLARLAAHDVEFGALPLTDYFWKHAAAIAAAPNGPLAFLCAMGLTLEQANLDFTLMYRDAFRAAGDEESARVIQRVHDDEIGHVKLAVTWARRLGGAPANERSDVEVYAVHAPFPFSLARAKGRRFDAAARAKAGLSTELVEAVRDARPYSDPSKPENA